VPDRGCGWCEVLCKEGDGLGGLLVGAAAGERAIEPAVEELDVLDGASAVNETPDCRMSSRRIRISDRFRLRLYEMSQGISYCSSPFRWK
jgi:hypothetical protein